MTLVNTPYKRALLWSLILVLCILVISLEHPHAPQSESRLTTCSMPSLRGLHKRFKLYFEHQLGISEISGIITARVLRKRARKKMRIADESGKILVDRVRSG